MEEYSRMLIEEYCAKHHSKKRERLAELVERSYDVACDVTESDAIFLDKVIEAEKNDELRAALEDLNNFLFYC